ncbi:MAG: hypothetical protein WCF18_03420 [Chthoniobacteraceae bacterium]
MNFAPPFYRVVEHVDRRALGAVQLVDAVTRLPVAAGAKVEVRHAALAGVGAPVAVPLSARRVQVVQNRSGLLVILRAPFFDDYSDSFDDPPNPPETPAGTRLRLRLAVIDAGPSYLPQEFDFELPRPLDRTVAENVFQPRVVELFRAPGAPVLGGWSVLRVRVTQEGTAKPLPGVLVRVYRGPRATDAPIGQGMSEWRGDLRGEALVAVADLPRFRPGGGANVFETSQSVHLEATRDTAFSGAREQFPDMTKIISGTAPGIIRRRSDLPAGPPPPALAVNPPAPLDIRPGRETAIDLTMP